MVGAPSILIIHDYYPGQFGALAMHLAARGWDVTFATRKAPNIHNGYRVVFFEPHRQPSNATHPYAQTMDRAVLIGQGFARMALELRKQGYKPDLILCHSGWGAGLFAKDVFPNAKLVSYFEWWYNSPGTDISYLKKSYPELKEQRPDAAMSERARNAHLALDFLSADVCLCPTNFQAAQFPGTVRRNLIINHDGIDCAFFSPGSSDDPTLGGWVPYDAKVVTFATRGMEPHRGFPEFMKAIPSILSADPHAYIVIAGSNGVFYGPRAFHNRDWKAEALAELDIDPRRVFFTGALDIIRYRNLLRRSNVHVYLTVPFVLSWSMLEAMSTASRLVLSNTEPVSEFAGDEHAVLTEISPPAIASAVLAALSDSSDRPKFARQNIMEKVQLENCLSFKMKMFLKLI